MSHDTQSGWLPIESAPRDGSEILAFEGRRAYWIVRWRDRDEFYDREGWETDATDSYHETIFVQPTHWMPLPSPPESPHV